ncbi:diacylglycerol/lipid kinase family protein [Nocardiopsis trehalosi]|uniref:diacylglycerol/lipid kinase family protein n=1 Tax=Nocardiopsis trehalosi TaxID=109329 RepID=UPI00082A7BED|nr:YegS/Rv2252/BmrU family lipid kinase [Nocardiopsis trehalosi]
MGRDVSLLVNPASGSGRAAAVAVRLLRELRSRGADPAVLVGRTAADSDRLARAAVAEGTGALVAVGGDGLVHTALQAVAGTDVPLGVVPAGTGNDIARAFGAPAAVPAAAEVVLRGRAATADTVRAGGRHVLSVLACGFDARVNERVNASRLRLGRAGYVLGAVAELGSFTPVPFRLDVDGTRVAADGMLVAVGNTACYGGGMRVCPDAVPDDGLLDVVLVRAVSRAAFLRFFPLVFSGAHTRLDEVTVLRGRRVRIATAPGAAPVPAYADGERLGAPPLTCEAVPGAVRVLC